jgi:membrane-bound ClpP family serine protease
VQIIINLGLIFLPVNKISYLALILTITGILFVAFRLFVQGKKALLRGIDISDN